MSGRRLELQNENALVGRLLGLTIKSVETEQTDKNVPDDHIRYIGVDHLGGEVDEVVRVFVLANKAKNQMIGFKQNLEIRLRHEMSPPFTIVVADKYLSGGYSEDMAILLAYKKWSENYICVPNSTSIGSNVLIEKLHPFVIVKNEERNTYTAIYLPTGKEMFTFDKIKVSESDNDLVFWLDDDFNGVQVLGSDLYTMSLAIALTKALNVDFVHLLENAYYKKLQAEIPRDQHKVIWSAKNKEK